MPLPGAASAESIGGYQLAGAIVAFVGNGRGILSGDCRAMVNGTAGRSGRWWANLRGIGVGLVAF